MSEQTLGDAINETRKSIERFKKIEGKPWGVEGAVIELVKQVGELSSLVVNKEGYYYNGREKENSKYNSTKENIADELADIMFAVVRIADYYAIDLVATNAATRLDEDKFLKKQGV